MSGEIAGAGDDRKRGSLRQEVSFGPHACRPDENNLRKTTDCPENPTIHAIGERLGGAICAGCGAVDRGNQFISGLFQQFHPAVLRAIKVIVDAGNRNGIPVSICGEMAADPLAVPLLVGLGFDSLSVSPAVIPQIKNMIVRLNYSDAKAVAAECLELKTENEIKIKLVEFFNKNLPGAEFNMEVENDDI